MVLKQRGKGFQINPAPRTEARGFLRKKLLIHPSIPGLMSGALGVRGKGGEKP